MAHEFAHLPRYTPQSTHTLTATCACPVKSERVDRVQTDTNLDGSSGRTHALVCWTQMALLTHRLGLFCFYLGWGKIKGSKTSLSPTQTHSAATWAPVNQCLVSARKGKSITHEASGFKALLAVNSLVQVLWVQYWAACWLLIAPQWVRVTPPCWFCTGLIPSLLYWNNN